MNAGSGDCLFCRITNRGNPPTPYGRHLLSKGGLRNRSIGRESLSEKLFTQAFSRVKKFFYRRYSPGSLSLIVSALFSAIRSVKDNT